MTNPADELKLRYSAGSRLLVAFSGGVDSSVSAHLCLKAGYRVLAVHLRFLPEDAGGTDETKVRQAAAALGEGLELQFLDLRQEFREQVMHRCWDVFASGRTPNPCVLCNPVFKFGKLMEYAKDRGCIGMATGHYAKIIPQPDGTVRLQRGDDRAKDQSYFLCRLTQEQLRYACFPAGCLEKAQVREIAAGLGLPNADAKESQDACFTPKNGSLAEMLRETFNGTSWNGCFIHAETGKILGRHKGIHAYTIGQRKGTGVALGTPAYIQKIDSVRGNVYITADEQTLFRDHLTAGQTVWQCPVPENPIRAMVQIRYRSPAAPATVTPAGQGRISVQFDSPLRAVTPGQAAAIYDPENKNLLGGGIID